MVGNNAIYVNQPYQTDGHITVRGSDWLFAVCAIMGAATFGFLGWSLKKPFSDRIFYYITASITATACIAYYTMASNLGYAAVNIEFQRSNSKVAGITRQIFYARYIDWVVTTPLLLLDILLTAGMNWSNIWFTLFLDEVMIITGLLAALTSSSYKWGFFVAGCVAYLGIIYEVLINARRNAARIGSDVSRLFLTISGWTILLWTLYPIAFGLSEGGNVISSDSESVFYGVLDVLAKPVFGAILLWGHRSIDLSRLGLNRGDRFNVPTGTHVTTAAA